MKGSRRKRNHGGSGRTHDELGHGAAGDADVLERPKDVDAPTDDLHTVCPVVKMEWWRLIHAGGCVKCE